MGKRACEKIVHVIRIVETHGDRCLRVSTFAFDRIPYNLAIVVIRDKNSIESLVAGNDGYKDGTVEKAASGEHVR